MSIFDACSNFVEVTLKGKQKIIVEHGFEENVTCEQAKEFALDVLHYSQYPYERDVIERALLDAALQFLSKKQPSIYHAAWLRYLAEFCLRFEGVSLSILLDDGRDD